MNKHLAFLGISVTLLVILGSLAHRTVQAVPAEPEAVTVLSIQWENSKALTNSSNAPQSALQPVITAAPDGKTVLVAYLNETSSGNTDPYYVRSTDNGKTWSNPAEIYTNDATDARFINVTTDASSNGHAVWVEDNLQIWYRKQSQWGSNNPGSIHSISAGVGNLIESPQIISNGGGNLHIVWSQQTAYEGDIYHMASSNGGDNWGTATPIANDSGKNYISPSLTATQDGKLHVVWEAVLSSVPPLSEIYYAQSININDNNVTWTTPITITSIIDPTPDNRVFAQPKIVAEGNRLLLAFENRPADSNQKAYFATCSTNCANINNWNGTVVTPQTYSIKNTDPAYLKPQPAVVGGCDIVLFGGINGDAATNNEKIRESGSCDNWSSNLTVSGVDAFLDNNANSRAIRPAATMHNNWWLYLVFEGKDTSRSDIYFVRNIPALYLPVILRSP